MNIVMQYSKEKCNLMDMVAEAMGGTVEGNFIKGDNSCYRGTHLFLEIETGISALLLDTFYKEEVYLESQIEMEGMVGFYYHLTTENFEYELNNQIKIIGALSYNLSIIDLGIPANYRIPKATHTYTICIYLKRELLKKYLSEIKSEGIKLEKVFDIHNNAIIHMDRMGNKSLNLINDFKRISYDSPLCEIYFRGLVYDLISAYLEELPQKKIFISPEIKEDVKSIISSKQLMLSEIEKEFPGIDFLAAQVRMSATKYKRLFTKITGVSPGVFFSSNKLHHAKKLLETGEFTISELAEKLSYYNDSYFAKRFYTAYGIYPKEYQCLL